MLDAYTHLDLTSPDPIADMTARMIRAGVDHALAVETWKADNLSWLHRLMEEPSAHFRVVLCFRPVLNQSFPDILQNHAVMGLRARTEDIAKLQGVASWLQTSGKWLVPHAEQGIGALATELLALAEHAPGLPIYVPHLGWPTQDGAEDADWDAAMTALHQIPSVVVGISAIAHFSRQPFPHADVERYAARLLELFGPAAVVAASDYPLMEKDRYTDYLQLAQRWIRRADAEWSPSFEQAFSGTPPKGGKTGV